MRQWTLPFSIALALALSAPQARAASTWVHLFEWKWLDIAAECESFLGPQGYTAVQVSPPQENIVWPGRPWYERYQPVSYDLKSRSGNEAEFREMVSRCKRAGVDIVVDAVINHMASLPRGSTHGTGVGGSTFTAYKYPGWYEPWDFHYCRGTGLDNELLDFSSRRELQDCELVNLPDLDTSSDYVRGRISGFLDYLLDIGVAGFRIDAAKHIATADLQAILGKMRNKPRALYSEVIDHGDSVIPATEYLGAGDVSEFKYGMKLAHVFRTGKLAWLERFGEPWGFLPAGRSVVFTDNHDTQRYDTARGDALSYKDGALYRLANVFMLAWPYGTPLVMSSFAFHAWDQGPPARFDQCRSDWICEHRWPEIAAMARFRKVAGAEGVTDWWSDGENRIAFGRGARGFVVINRDARAMPSTRLKTSLPAGRYCDAKDVDRGAKRCQSAWIAVDAAGWLELGLAPLSSAVIHAGTREGNL